VELQVLAFLDQQRDGSPQPAAPELARAGAR
jgi:hypothetical protein